MTTHPIYRLHKSIGYQLSVVSRQQERRLDEQLRTIGLTRITWCVLLAVGNENLVHPSEIAEFVGIDRTATSRALRQMETSDLIARKAGAGDRRMTSVELTRKGKDLLAKGTPMASSNGKILAERLGSADLNVLYRILAKLRVGEEPPLPRL